MQEEFIRSFKAPAAPEHMAGEEYGKRSKRKERPVSKWVHKRQVGVTKASRLVLFWILFGTRVQMVKVVEEEVSIRQEMDRMLEKVHQEDENL